MTTCANNLLHRRLLPFLVATNNNSRLHGTFNSTKKRRKKNLNNNYTQHQNNEICLEKKPNRKILGKNRNRICHWHHVCLFLVYDIFPSIELLWPCNVHKNNSNNVAPCNKHVVCSISQSEETYTWNGIHTKYDVL